MLDKPRLHARINHIQHTRMCPSSDNDCKRQYVYGLYDKQTGRLMDYSTNEVIANGAIIDPQTGRPLPGFGRDRCPGFTKSCRD